MAETSRLRDSRFRLSTRPGAIGLQRRGDIALPPEGPADPSIPARQVTKAEQPRSLRSNVSYRRSLMGRR